MTRRKKVFFICGAIVLIVVANAFLLAHVYLSPSSIARAIRNYARDELGCTVEIAAADLSLLGFLELKDIKLFTPDQPAQEPFLTVDQVVVDYSLWRLIWGRNGIDAIEIARPRLKLDRDLITFLQGLSSGKGSSGRRAVSKKISILAGTIAIDSGILYEDSPLLELTDFRIEVESGSYSGSQLTFNGGATQAGVGNIVLTGRADLDAKRLSLGAKLPRVEIGDELRKLLPEKALEQLDDLGLEGQTGIAVEMKYEWGDKKHFSQTFVATPSDCSVRRKELPLPLTQVAGRLESDGKTLLIKSVTARYKGGTVEMPRGLVNKGRAEFDITARGLPLNDEMKEALPREARSIWDDLKITGGKGDVEHHFTLHKDGGRRFPVHSLKLKLSGVSATFKDFPYTVEQLGGDVSWQTPKPGETTCSTVSVAVEGAAGKGTVEVDGRIPVPPVIRPKNGQPQNYVFPGDSPDITIKAERLELDDKLRVALAAVSQEVVDILDVLHAVGNVDATVLLWLKHNGQRGSVTSKTVIVDLNGIEATVEEFPYPVTDLTGQVEWDGTTVKLKGLSGRCGQARVSIFGEIEPGKFKDPASKQTITVSIEGLQLETLAQKELANYLKTINDGFAPSGGADIDLTLRLADGGKVILEKTVVSLNSCAATYTGFTYPLESLTGQVVVENNTVVLDNIEGHVPGRETEIRVSGQIILDKEDERKSVVHIDAKYLWLDDVLLKALGQTGTQIWGDFSPSGRVNALCVLEFERDHKEDIVKSITIDLLNCEAAYKGFPYPLENIMGMITVKGGTILLENVVAGMGKVRISGQLLTQEEAATDANDDPGQEPPAERSTLNIHATNIAFDDALRKAMPTWGETWGKLKPKGLFSGDFMLIIPADGPIRIDKGSKLSISGLSLKGLRLPEATFPLTMDEEFLNITDFEGSYYGGKVKGNIRFGRKDNKWETNVNLYNLDLKQINDEHQFIKGQDKLRGQMVSTIELAGEAGRPDSLAGSATVQVYDGRLVDIPVLADIFMSLVLRFKWPESKTITSADISCTVGNGEVDFSEIILKGTTVPITGKGTIALNNGALNMTFVSSKDTTGLIGFIPFIGKPLEKWLIDPVLKGIVQVKVTGTVSKPKIGIVPLRIDLIDDVVKAPFEALIGLFKKKQDDKEQENGVHEIKGD